MPRRVALGGTLCLCLATCSPASAQSFVPPDGTTAQAVSSIVANALKAANLPGAAVAVTRGDHVVQVAGYGRDSNGRPVTEHTAFYIGSASKAMTAVAVMQFVDAGRVDLDAPVRRYLAEFRLADTRSDDITVRQLLNHTSGMWDVGFRQWAFPQPTSLQAAVARLHRAGLAAAPGTAHRYFNPNYSVAARLVETLSHESFDAYMRNHIFLPLGMTATKTVDFVDEARDDAAPGYIFVFGRPLRAPGGPFFVSGAGGVVTTPADMAQWVAAQANDGVGPNGVRVVSSRALAETRVATPASNGYGFGWNVYPDGRISHSGGLPTHSAYVAFFTAGDGVAVFAPTGNSNVPRDIALAVLEHLKGKAAPQPSDAGVPTLDLVAAVLIAANALFTARSLARTTVWLRRPRSVWQTARGLAPHAIAAGAVLVGMPIVVGRLIPWSWIWLGYAAPLWTVLLLFVAATSLLIVTIRVVACVASSKAIRWSRPRPGARDPLRRT